MSLGKQLSVQNGDAGIILKGKVWFINFISLVLKNYQKEINKIIETIINSTEDDTGKTERYKLWFITYL